MVWRCLRRLLGLFVCCAGVSCVLRERTEPAAAGLSCLFKSNNFHLFSGVPELFSGEPVRCTSFFNEGCRHRSVRQNVHQKDFWIFPSVGGCLIVSSVGGGRPALNRLNMSFAIAAAL